MDYVLAQVNIGRILGPMDGDIMRDFAAGLEEVNAAAEASPGFVWRLKTEDGDATAIRPFDDDMLLINMSTWASVESLHGYVYGPLHLSFLRRRREWFARLTDAYTALWWQPSGMMPTVAEAAARIERLRRDGPSAEAFTFAKPAPMPGTALPERPREGCVN